MRRGHDGAVAGYDAVALNTKDGRRQLVVLANALAPDDGVGEPKAQRAFGRLVDDAACAHP